MINKILCILLLLLFIILLIKLYEKIHIYKRHNTYKTLKLFDTLNNNNLDNNNTNNIYNNIEHFEQSAWTTDKDILKEKKQPLNDTQKEEVKNMINQLGKEQLKTLIAQQSPLLTGPSGPPGPQGPAGTTLISSGRLVNKVGSFSKKDNKDKKINDFYPEFVVSRTEGTNAASSLCFMDKISPFTSYQNWELNVNNQIRNRYDNNCLTMDNKNDKVYISQCGDNPNQKWTWDNSNRIISITNSSPNKLKCVGLTKPEINMLTTNVPGCKDNSCSNNIEREFLVVKDCDVNNINKDEIWSFV